MAAAAAVSAPRGGRVPASSRPREGACNRAVRIASACLLLAAGAAAQAPAPPKPANVLILYSDDHSYHALGAMGNPVVRTPNLDRLAASGTLWTQAHVMGGHQGAVCIPSRAMLLTGRYVNRLPGDGGRIPDSLSSLPELLRRRGYTTYHTGKWHSDKASHGRMFGAGGDIFFGGMHFNEQGGQEHPLVYRYDSSGRYPDERKRRSDTFSTTLYADNAVRFLSSPIARENPFLCYVAFTSPHDPRSPPPSFLKRYDPEKMQLPPNFLPRHPFDNGDLSVRDEQLLPVPRDPKAVKGEIARYYGMIGELDAQVGRILAALRRNGLSENTVVVFAGDNGLAVGQHGLLGKQNLYEHSIRVPMIVAGPGLPKGGRNDAFVYLSDIAPTLLELLGIPRPQTFEGLSFLQLFHRPGERTRRNIYNVYGHWSRSIKTEEGYKLILYNVDGQATTQLFDLRNDPWETKDLSGDPAQRERIASMRRLLRQEMRLAHDDLDIDLPDWGRKPGQRSRGS